MTLIITCITKRKLTNVHLGRLLVTPLYESTNDCIYIQLSKELS